MSEENIKEFFDGAKSLLKESALDKKDLDNFFSQLRFRLEIFQATKKRMDVYLASDFNVFDYVDPNENLLSDIIRDLLNPAGKHGQDDIFLKEFLKLVGKSENYKAQRVNLIREDTTKYIIKSQRRMDIVIDFNKEFALVIENKPWAEDQKDQIKDYRENLEMEYTGKYLLLYLSRDGKSPSDWSIPEDLRKSLEIQKKFMTISYNDVKNWLEFCYKECRAEKVRWFLRDFIEYVEEEFKQSLMEREGGEENGE